MKVLRSEKGVALVMVMVIALIGLAVVSAMLFMLTEGTRISGINRAYRTAEEAGIGGAKIAAQFIDKNVATALNDGTVVGPVTGTLDASTACMVEKLTLPNVVNGSTGTSNWSACSASDLFDPSKSPDLTIPLSGATAGQDFTVTAKIVDTLPGSSDTTGLVTPGTNTLAGVADQSNEYRPGPNPYLYRVEIQSQDSGGRGVARYSILYAY